MDLLLHLNHFKLLIKNYNEQNGFQFHSTSIAIQQKSNEDSFSKLNKIYKNKISKGKKHEKRKQPLEKSSTSVKKIKLTKSNTTVELKNPTQKIMLSFEYIRKENRHLNLNLIFYYSKACFDLYLRSFKRSIYFIRFYFFLQTNSIQLHSQREITLAK